MDYPAQRQSARQALPVANPSSGQTAWQTWLAGALLVLLVSIVYWPTLANGFVWDDDVYVEGNPTLRSGEGLRDIWFKIGAVPQYYPLVHTSYWVEMRLWGTQPAGYHAVNMALHTVSVLLAWRLLVRLAVPGAWLAAAIFAVHPVGVESVAWVTERKNVLSFALALGSLLAYLRFAPAVPLDGHGPPTRRGSYGYYALALLLYVAALLAKSVTASVPAVFLVIYWWKRGRVTRRDALRLVPFFAVGLAMAALTVWMERSFVGAEGEDWDLATSERVLIAGRALWFYAGKLLRPYPLIFFYPRWTIDASAWWQYLFPLGAVAVMVALWLLRGRVGRGPLAAVLIFSGVLAPALGFFNIYPFRYSFVADHFQYHASLALIALFAAGLASVAVQRLRALPWLVPLTALIVLACLAVLARQKTYAYHDQVALYEDTLALNPACWAAHLNIGVFLLERGDYQAAVDHYREALRINPRHSSLHVSLATALYLTGRTDEAVAQLQQAMQANLADYDRAIAHAHWGIILLEQGRYDEAIEHFRSALELRPDYATALHHYGGALAAQGKLSEGIEKVRASLSIHPNSALAQNELGTLLLRQGKAGEAIAPLKAAVRLQGNLPKLREDLAAALLATAQPAAAEDQLRRSLAITPRSAGGHYLLGRALLAQGHPAAAAEEFNTTLSIKADYPGAEEALSRARQSVGQR